MTLACSWPPKGVYDIACLSPDLRYVCRQWGLFPSRYLLTVRVAAQAMTLGEKNGRSWGEYRILDWYRVSTSRYGMGAEEGSNRTPLGLHRIAGKIGGGQPYGAVFQGRRPVGLTWQGRADAAIAHRILWLEGLEPGKNRGGKVDSHRRYIYLHGLGDETTLGRPASRGCVHVAGNDLLPLFDRVPSGTWVWILP